MNYIADEFLKKLYILSKVKESVCYVKNTKMIQVLKLKYINSMNEIVCPFD